MYDVRRRVRKIENELSVGKEHRTVTIILFGGELPPDRKEGNITYHHVMYDKRAKQ
jgi:hypothetical protein